MKCCSRCGVQKSLSSFKKDKRWADGLRKLCKQCTTYGPGNFKYFVTNSWRLLNSRTINGHSPLWDNPSSARYLRQGIRLEMTRDEFGSWCELNRDLIMDFYLRDDKPSINRKDSSKNYCLDNIEIISFRENTLDGVKNHAEKSAMSVIGTDIRTGEVRLFKSMRDASRITGAYATHISSCVRGKRYWEKGIHMGFKWELADANHAGH